MRSTKQVVRTRSLTTPDSNVLAIEHESRQQNVSYPCQRQFISCYNDRRRASCSRCLLLAVNGWGVTLSFKQRYCNLEGSESRGSDQGRISEGSEYPK